QPQLPVKHHGDGDEFKWSSCVLYSVSQRWLQSAAVCQCDAAERQHVLDWHHHRFHHRQDSCGNSTNCSFTVTVTRPPIVLTCSSNITVTAASSNGAVVFFSNSASGGCSPPPSVNAMPP